jgi:hypothetical protein
MMVKGFGAGKAVICLLPKRFDTTKTQTGPNEISHQVGDQWRTSGHLAMLRLLSVDFTRGAKTLDL